MISRRPRLIPYESGRWERRARWRGFLLSVLDAIDDDDDGDGLTQAREKELGTNAAPADTDGDGFSDGAECAGGFQPFGSAILSGVVGSVPDFAHGRGGGELARRDFGGGISLSGAPLAKGIELSVQKGRGTLV